MRVGGGYVHGGGKHVGSVTGRSNWNSRECETDKGNWFLTSQFAAQPQPKAQKRQRTPFFPRRIGGASLGSKNRILQI